jgi:hypothetical protein
MPKSEDGARTYEQWRRASVSNNDRQDTSSSLAFNVDSIIPLTTASGSHDSGTRPDMLRAHSDCNANVIRASASAT